MNMTLKSLQKILPVGQAVEIYELKETIIVEGDECPLYREITDKEELLKCRDREVEYIYSAVDYANCDYIVIELK